MIGRDVTNPNHAFLEFVKKAAVPTPAKKQIPTDFLKRFFDLSRTKAIQNGQIKLSHEPA